MARPRSIAVSLLFCSAALFIGSSVAEAAVRECLPVVSSGIFKGKGELATKKLALDGWKEKVKAFGENYTNWRLAAARLIECLPAKGGGFECVAHGSPCLIEQVPQTPDKPRKKKTDI